MGLDFLGSIELWFEYFLRFSHLVAGIAWIGSSFYFIWLDSSFEPPSSPRKNVEGEVFMVHGGFYYQVDKRKIYPGELPPLLHWFKWEATLTWITGIFLLIFLYYLKGASLLIDPSKNPMTQPQAVGMSVSLLVGSWLIYDLLLWNPKYKGSKLASGLATLIFLGALIYLNTRLFSGRGAFIQTGAMFGTMMLANVWIRILPGQTKMLNEAKAGRVPDYSVGLKSKTRSVANTYFTFPVLFIMLSNHYPQIYNHPQSWALLIILSIAGALVRHTMVTKNPVERWLLLPAAMGVMALVMVLGTNSAKTGEVGARLNFSDIQPILTLRCQTCHSQHPTDDIFKEAPKGALLDTEAQALALAEKIYQQVFVGRVMPLGNKTAMTEEERILLSRWADQARVK